MMLNTMAMFPTFVICHRIDLRAYAKARGLEIVQEYIDYASGSKNDRENYLRLFDDVRKRRTDCVFICKVDKFARSIKELITAL